VSLPLEGIRVLDLSRLLPGGFCSLLLADFGAEVLKVEDTGMGDYIRWSPPFYDTRPPGHDSAKSALFLSLNRNKRSIRLNLKHERGREALLALVREHDVVLESFRPGVLDRLGVGYERMREENPAIVYCAISGYGQDGPKREASGHDMNYLGLIGLLGLTGERGGGGGEVGGGPVQSAGQIADLGGGALMAAFGILAALRERDGSPGRASGTGSGSPGRPAHPGSGEGQLVDVSMSDGALSWLAMVAGAYFADGVVPRRGELPLAGSLICYRPYECADGWVSLGALEPKFWQAFCRGVGREELIGMQFERPGSDAHARVQEIFKARSRADWEAFAREHDCCLEPVLELDEALSSDPVRERGMVVELQQPGVEGPVRQLGIPVKLTRTPGRHDRLPGPALGEHTEEALLAAGYSEAEVTELLASGAAAGPAEASNRSAPAPTFRA
jgi:alpha-methylacyl-CoA racemase